MGGVFGLVIAAAIAAPFVLLVLNVLIYTVRKWRRDFEKYN
jgi:uncharacterized membrane protein